MVQRTVGDLLLAVATFPFIYYLLVLYSSFRFFRRPASPPAPAAPFTPPVSMLKPIRGVDPDAYQNFASFCRQDYPEYEILFCVGSSDDPVLPLLDQLRAEFPDCRIRTIFLNGAGGTNDKVAKLDRLVVEARHEVLVINDSDVRVRPDYIRTVVAPLADESVGAVTCFYVSISDATFADRLQTVGMISDFYAGILVARQLDGVKFALGPTIATRRVRLAQFGGYRALVNRPADDLLVGRLIAEQGREVVLLPYTIQTVADYRSFGDLWSKRLRWLVVMRHMRPWGHIGLVFTQGLAWAIIAFVIHPSLPVALGYGGGYLALRMAMTWEIGVRGLRQRGMGRKMLLLPVWDLFAFILWLASFFRRRVRWRDADYHIREGHLVPLAPRPVDD